MEENVMVRKKWKEHILIKIDYMHLRHTLIVSITAPAGPTRNLSSRSMVLTLKLLLVSAAGALDFIKFVVMLFVVLRRQRRT